MFLITTVTEFAEGGVDSLQDTTPFDEAEFLQANLDLIQAVLGVPLTVDSEGSSVPFKPTVTFE